MTHVERPWLTRAAEIAQEYLDSLSERPVGAVPFADARAALDRPLLDAATDPTTVIEELASAVGPGLIGSAGPRYFGFVIGGGVPAAVAADWLTSVWDQNAGLSATSPAAAAVEDVVARWVLDLLGLPPDSGVGLVSGCQMASFTGLAAARHAVLARAGWDVERDGLTGAPAVTVLVGEEAHATIYSALRMLGFGTSGVVRVAADREGRMRADALRDAMPAGAGPLIVCAQAGNVNTGAFDPLAEIIALTHARGGWVHVDGAFGLWARASASHAHLAAGVEAADSWATDAHKWLNVPYDSGLAIVRDAAAHRAPLLKSAAYFRAGSGAERDPQDFVPESSRRARGFVLYAALRSLGRAGVAELVDRSCRHARRMAARLAGAPGAHVLNEVVLNQVLVRFDPPGGGDADAFTSAVADRVQRDGTCWLWTTRRQNQTAIRISIVNWATTDEDIDRSADAILAAAARQL